MRDRVGHVEGGGAHRAPRTGGEIADGVVGVGRVGHPVHRAGDGRHPVRLGAAHAGIAVGPDIRLARDVAQVVEADGLGGDAAAGRGAARDPARPRRAVGQTVEAVIAELLDHALVVVGAGDQVADRVPLIVERRDRVGGTGAQVRQPPRGRVEGVGGDDAVTGSRLRQRQFGAGRVRASRTRKAWVADRAAPACRCSAPSQM